MGDAQGGCSGLAVRMRVTRRGLLAMALGGAAAPAISCRAAASAASLRLGVLPFGTVQWIADVIRRHGLDAAHGFRLDTIQLANTEAAKVALIGNAVDVAVSDWPFVASQRSHGGHLTFAPFSGALGGIMAPADAGPRSLADLRGKRLGVGGGAADKSWLLVQAAARKQGIDLTREASLSYGAPPLLSATLAQGRLDALLTFWNFCARLEAKGYREAISVDDCARMVGLDQAPVLVGYVFDEPWATANRTLIGGFLRASAAAQALLASDAREWVAIRPLMDTPDERVFAALKARFLAGLRQLDSASMAASAQHLQTVLVQAGLAREASLPFGVFWQG
jgi:NitT/TauT family transport system substrate-binding protein